MQLFVGTSGFSYPAWRGKFYPAKFPQREMLSYYADRFAAVEINNSFYRMPETETLREWARQVPPGYQFALKAPQTITHRRRLKHAEEETRAFLSAAAALKRRRGPLLFQLPPNFKKDLPRLQAFLKCMRKGTPATFEFRHASWYEDDVCDLLKSRACVLCAADADSRPPAHVVNTAGWGYIRLRRERYTRRDLMRWIETIRSQDWDFVYVFFKHEDTGTGPRFATRFLELWES